MFEPPPTADTVEDAIAAEVEMVEIELRRIDQRLAALNWGPAPAHRTGTLTWCDFALGLPVEHDDGDAVARQVLQHKRQALVLELERLRRRLVGEGGREQRRGRWG